MEKRKDIIVRMADKGGGVVIMTKELHYSQLTEMLNNENTYTELKGDPTRGYRHDLMNLVDYGFDNKVLTKKKKRYLVPCFSRIPTIYSLPKVHKNTTTPGPDL